MKALDQIEPRTLIGALPYTITQPGSYYLSTNLSGVSGKNGILIQADHVTVDLNGFALRGTAGALSGIAAPAAQTDVVVRNGSVQNWPGPGVDLARVSQCRAEGLRLNGNGAAGFAAGPQSILASSSASDNVGPGFQAAEGSLIRACVAARNGADGMAIGDAGSVVECTALGNVSGIRGGSGSRVIGCNGSTNLLSGIIVATNARVADCVAQSNQSVGIAALDGAQVESCVAANNGDAGITAGNDARIAACKAQSNAQDGIRVGLSGIVSGCTATWNRQRGIWTDAGAMVESCLAGNNVLSGIQVRNVSQVLKCKAHANGGGGISADDGSTVSDCSSQNNVGDGVVVAANCRVTGNHCQGNTSVVFSAGVHAVGSKNVIQDNKMTSNDRGLSLDAAGNFVARNIASNNSLNYRITGTQVMGPTLTSLDDPSTSQQPWANFDF